ncbi:DUF2207 domain-containing protein [Lederbergia ruris]|uniref:DUF2207 domain-containing protein n=1 Tax=Lederbergia ruris TaxID=217495 RepID=UPI0039A26452
MFSKTKTLFIVIPIFLLFFFPAKVEARSFSIDAVDVNAYIYPDGDLYVEELYTYTFAGKFNGTTRIIGDDDFDGVEFFEGYQVPDDAEMGKITPENVTPLQVEREDYTYKVHRPYKDETKKVFYRYRLKNVANKYEDVGEFYWRFFDEMGDNDLNHLRIFVHLYGENQLSENTHGFIHDLTGGKMELTESGLYYHNEKLPGGEPFELRLLFPSEFLSEMEYTENKEMLPTMLAEEDHYKKKLSMRNDWLPISEKVSLVFFILFLVLSLYAIIFPKRLVRFFGRSADFSEIEKLDSFILVALKRKLKFMPEDINAVLFRLHQKGYVSVEHIPSSLEYQEDEYAPDHTFTFILEKESSDLSEHEKYFIDWLFTETQDGKRVFSLDQIPLSTIGTETQNWRNKEQRGREIRDFEKQFKEWKKLASKDPELHRWIEPVKLRKIFKYGIIPVWLIWTVINLIMGMGDRLEVYLGMGGIAIVYLFIAFGKHDRVLSTILFFILLVVIFAAGLDPGMEYLQATAFPLILISAFLPTVSSTYYGAAYYRGMKKWIKGLRKNQLQLPTDEARLETCFQHAIALEQGSLFESYYGEKIHATTTGELYPFLIAPVETAQIYSYHHIALQSTYSSSYSSSSGGGSSGSSGGSGGGGGAGAF